MCPYFIRIKLASSVVTLMCRYRSDRLNFQEVDKFLVRAVIVHLVINEKAGIELTLPSISNWSESFLALLSAPAQEAHSWLTGCWQPLSFEKGRYPRCLDGHTKIPLPRRETSHATTRQDIWATARLVGTGEGKPERLDRRAGAGIGCPGLNRVRP